MFPPSQPGDAERIRWENVPSDLERRVVGSEEELKNLFEGGEFKDLFPEEDYEFGEVRLIEKGEIQWRERYTQYGRVNKRYLNRLEPVAYKCPACDKIVIGPPKVEDDTSIYDGVPLSGSLGYYVHCANCDMILDSHTIMQS